MADVSANADAHIYKAAPKGKDTAILDSIPLGTTRSKGVSISKKVQDNKERK
jgi:hypothetical protein